MDEILYQCNETELLTMAHRQGLGRLKRGLQKDTLVGIVSGNLMPQAEHMAETNYTRKSLELFIGAPDAFNGVAGPHWNTISGQLPGCTGMCTTFNCSEAKHAACFMPNEERVR